MHHDIKTTWILVRYTRDNKKVLVNLYWLLREKYFLLMISDIQLPREIELSNGNIMISDGIGLDVIDCTKTYNIKLKFTGIDIIIGVNKDRYVTWRYSVNKKNNYLADKYILFPENIVDSDFIGTELDSEVQRLNKRMSLISARRAFGTDGVQLIETDNTNNNNKEYIKQNTLYTDDCRVKEEVVCKVTDGGFVNTGHIDALECKIEADEHVNLRFIDGVKFTSILTDDNIHCDGIFRSMIGVDMLTRTKRVIDCVTVPMQEEVHDMYIDLSNLDLIDKYRIRFQR